MRIVGGALRGRPLTAPSDKAIRPTTDRVREALFNILSHAPWAEDVLDEAEVIDGCCGSGALGLEALSRGARHCTFIDSDRTSIELAKQNAEQLGVSAQCRFLQTDITKLPRPTEPAGLVLIDAPYKSDLAETGLAALAKAGWLAEGSLAVLESASKQNFGIPEGFEQLDDRRYGQSRLVFLSYQP